MLSSPPAKTLGRVEAEGGQLRAEMEPDGPGLLFDDAVALFGREVAVDFPWVSPSRLLPKSGLAGGDVFPMVAFATSWWYYSLGNSSWAMVTALPHQWWVALERSAPGRGGGRASFITATPRRRRRRTAGGFSAIQLSGTPNG